MRRPISQNRGKPNLREAVRRWSVRVVFWALLALTASALLAAAAFGLHRVLVSANPYFTLRRISLQGSHSLTEKLVRERLEEAGAVVGRSNLMQLPVRRLRQALERDPLIARAELVRRIPDLLEVSVVERVPIAVVRSRPPCFIDGDGVVLPWRDISKERLLPAITAVRNAARLTAGEQTQDDALRGAVRFLRLLARRADGVSYDVEVIQLDYQLPSLQVHLRPRGTFTEDAIIVVPVQGMEEALDRLRDIHRIRTASGKTTSFVDVTYRRNVPARP
jgi:cell division septal protein FtsQ